MPQCGRPFSGTPSAKRQDRLYNRVSADSFGRQGLDWHQGEEVELQQLEELTSTMASA